jgi:hypothetical protein
MGGKAKVVKTAVVFGKCAAHEVNGKGPLLRSLAYKPGSDCSLMNRHGNVCGRVAIDGLRRQ